MAALSLALEEILEQIAGEPVPFVLITHADQAAQYVANIQRSDGMFLLNALLTHWQQSQPDGADSGDLDTNRTLN